MQLYALVLTVIAAATPSPTPPAPDPCAPMLALVTRPTVATSPCTVRDGHVLLETGYTNATTTGAGGGSTVSYPQALVRIGAGTNLEFDLTPPSFNRSSVGGSIASGSSDMAFGAKLKLGSNDRAAWGVNAQLSAPTGDPAFTAGGTQYTFNANWSYALTSTFGASGTVGYNSLLGTNAGGHTERYTAWIPSLVLTAALPGTSQAFAEYAYFSHAGPGLGSRRLIDAGYQRTIGAHLQIDVEYGFQPTLVGSNRMHYVGFGLALAN